MYLDTLCAIPCIKDTYDTYAATYAMQYHLHPNHDVMQFNTILFNTLQFNAIQRDWTMQRNVAMHFNESKYLLIK